jgi:hypothetical protein
MVLQQNYVPKTRHERDLQFGKHSICTPVSAYTRVEFQLRRINHTIVASPGGGGAVRCVQRGTQRACNNYGDRESITSIKQISNTASIIMPHANECVCVGRQRANRKHVNGLCDVINSSSPT